MKITCISDTHNQHTHIPPDWLEGGDVLVHAGDVSGRGSLREVEEFLAWFN
jgi:predicted phosphodiesterase